MSVNSIPPEYARQALPMICCKDAAAAIEFYRNAFGATEIMRLRMPDGKLGYAEIEVAGARVMLSDEFPDWGALSPATLGGSAVALSIYVGDVDGLAERAKAAGAEILMPPSDQFYGDRACKLRDPAGHTWRFARRIENVPPDEMQRRCDKVFASGSTCS